MISNINDSLISQIHINKTNNSPIVLSNLENNQIINAKVLEILPNNKAVLLVNNQKIFAKTLIPLNISDNIELKVLQNQDTIVLKLVSSMTGQKLGQLSSIINFLFEDKISSKILNFKGVKDLLSELSLKSDKADKNFLPRLLEKNGMTWDKKLAKVLLKGEGSLKDTKNLLANLQKNDLKGLFLKAILLSKTDSNSKDVKEMKNYVKIIEEFQILNKNSSSSGRFLIPFPVLDVSKFSFGQLFIDMGQKDTRKGKNSDKLITISFLLNMTKIGAIRANFTVLNKAITGEFVMTDEVVSTYIESKIPNLIKNLAKIEYQVHRITCRIVKKEALSPSCFIESLVKDGNNQILNIVI